MTNQDFNRLYTCTFERDPAFVELENKLINYYRDSEHLNNLEARKLYRELHQWVRACGFTPNDFNRAKRIVSGMNKYD